MYVCFPHHALRPPRSQERVLAAPPPPILPLAGPQPPVSRVSRGRPARALTLAQVGDIVRQYLCNYMGVGVSCVCGVRGRVRVCAEADLWGRSMGQRGGCRAVLNSFLRVKMCVCRCIGERCAGKR